MVPQTSKKVWDVHSSHTCFQIDKNCDFLLKLLLFIYIPLFFEILRDSRISIFCKELTIKRYNIGGVLKNVHDYLRWK